MSNNLILRRAYLDNCTIGKIYYSEECICYSVERPWLNNEKNVSCIPAGVYDIKPFKSARHGDVYSLTSDNLGVGLSVDYQRNFILIHIANFPENVDGCIGVGMSLHSERWGVASSGKAVDMLFELIELFDIKKMEIY